MHFSMKKPALFVGGKYGFNVVCSLLPSIRLTLARRRKSNFDSLNIVDTEWNPNSQCFKILRKMKGKKHG